jgi:hypothetical protein
MKRVVLAALLAACGGHPHVAAPARPAHAPPTGNDPACPVEIPGTSATVEDTANGAAFVFVTTGDIDAVRELDVPGGARIEITSDDPASLQASLRTRAEKMASGSCRNAQ